MSQNTNTFPTNTPALDHERLDVYQCALDFHATVLQMLPRRGFRALRDQLERASMGVALNIAEGAGRTSAPDKRRFYEMARGSVTESAAVMDLFRIRRLIDASQHQAARVLAVRLAQMLSRLCSPPRG